MDSLKTLLERVRARWSELPEGQRPTVVGAVVVVTLVMLIIGVFTVRTPMIPLDRPPTDPVERADLLAALRGKGYKVEIQHGTGALLVPAHEKAEIEVEFGSVLQRNRSEGLELLDKQAWGTTAFREHTVYLRGLQGEIEMLLNTYRGVAGSKVLLSMQQDELFEEDRIEPSASVLLELKPGVDLTTAEGERMARQVAGAVVGLRPERVQILDAQMRILHASIDTDDEQGGSGLAAMQREWEHYYQRKVESLMFEMLGHGNASVRVSVDLDHAQRSVVERELDAANVVTVASKASEQSTETPQAATGVPGAETNLGGVQRDGSGAVSNRSTEALNIDVPETKKTDVTAPGRILAVSAAVAVNGTYVAAEGAEGAAPGEATFTPRTEQELTDLTALVRNALGPHAKEVTVVSHQFPRLDLTVAEAGVLSHLTSDAAGSVARYSLALFAFLFLYGMVLRPIVQNLTLPEPLDDEPVDATAMDAPELPAPEFSQPEFDVQGWLDKFSAGDQFVSRADVSRLVLADVAHSVVTLQEWLTEETDA